MGLIISLDNVISLCEKNFSPSANFEEDIVIPIAVFSKKPQVFSQIVSVVLSCSLEKESPAVLIALALCVVFKWSWNTQSHSIHRDGARTSVWKDCVHDFSTVSRSFDWVVTRTCARAGRMLFILLKLLSSFFDVLNRPGAKFLWSNAFEVKVFPTNCLFSSRLCAEVRAYTLFLKLASVKGTSCYRRMGCSKAISQATLIALFID